MSIKSFKGTKLCLDNTVLSALFIQLSPDDGNRIISLLKELGFEVVVSEYVYTYEFLRGLDEPESDFEPPFSAFHAIC